MPPIQSCSQTWINSSFIKNHLCPTGHFAITGCLQQQEQQQEQQFEILHMCQILLFCLTVYTILLIISYLENIASFANTSSSGATSTILPVNVSRAHLGSSGSYTICLETHNTRYYCNTHAHTHIKGLSFLSISRLTVWFRLIKQKISADIIRVSR